MIRLAPEEWLMKIIICSLPGFKDVNIINQDVCITVAMATMEKLRFIGLAFWLSYNNRLKMLIEITYKSKPV